MSLSLSKDGVITVSYRDFKEPSSITHPFCSYDSASCNFQGHDRSAPQAGLSAKLRAYHVVPNREDGRIDQWKVLSAEEASREVVHAMANRDLKALTAVLINRDDIKKLGIKEAYAKKLLDSVADPGKKLQKTLAGSKTLNAKTRWLRFDCSMPSTIPADKAISDKEIAVYENAMTIVDTAGKTHLLQIGELVRIGNCWKLTQIPVPLEGDSVQVSLGGFLMQPSLIDDGSAAQAASVSPETQRLLKQLQDLDRNSPPLNAGTAKLGRYNSQRADLLEKLIDTATTDQERNQWLQQLADGVAAAVQTGSYPNGLKRLKGIEDDIRKRSPKSPLVPYVSRLRIASKIESREFSSAHTTARPPGFHTG